MDNANNQPTEVQNKKPAPVLGILAIIFGGFSILPLLGVISVVGLILGIFSLVKKQFVTGTVGTLLSCVGIATSPILWILIACTFSSHGSMCEQYHKSKSTFDQKLQEDLKNNGSSFQSTHPLPTVAPDQKINDVSQKKSLAEQECKKTMEDYANKNGANAAKYIADNQTYLQTCMQNYMLRR